MSDVIAVRVSKELKAELDELDIDYADEVRKHLERKVKERKFKKALNEIKKFREHLRKKTGVTSASAESIRWDREHGH